jgi:hypothetical protein
MAGCRQGVGCGQARLVCLLHLSAIGSNNVTMVFILWLVWATVLLNGEAPLIGSDHTARYPRPRRVWHHVK